MQWGFTYEQKVRNSLPNLAHACLKTPFIGDATNQTRGSLGVAFGIMTRRTDGDTAEKVSISLLTRAAFGTDAGLRHALLSGLDVNLITSVFKRDKHQLRKDVQGVQVVPDRRFSKRDSDALSRFS